MGRAAWGAEAAVVPTAVEAMAAAALVEHLPTALEPMAPQPMELSQPTVVATAPRLPAMLLQVRGGCLPVKVHSGQVGNSCWQRVLVHSLLTGCSSTSTGRRPAHACWCSSGLHACRVMFMLRAGAWVAADLTSHCLQGMVSMLPSLHTALPLGAMVARPPMGLTPMLHRRRAASVAHQRGAPRRGKSWLTVSRLHACCTRTSAAASWALLAS